MNKNTDYFKSIALSIEKLTKIKGGTSDNSNNGGNYNNFENQNSSQNIENEDDRRRKKTINP
jgi:hypothetical protein